MNHKTNGETKTHEEKEDLISSVNKMRHDDGLTIRQATEKAGITQSQFYVWTRNRGNGNGVEAAREIKTRPDNHKMLKIENQRLRMIVADLMLDLQALKEWRARG